MGETGSGKSTRLPQFLLDSKITTQIAITQERVNFKSILMRRDFLTPYYMAYINNSYNYASTIVTARGG